MTIGISPPGGVMTSCSSMICALTWVANPSQKITLEGNTDERGAPEYNIALGEQRAKSVAGMMKIQGVSETQLNIVSYGEEKPAAFGNDESAWEKNRRTEIVYLPK